MKNFNKTIKAWCFRKSSLKTFSLLILMCVTAIGYAQVNTGGSATTSSHQKQVIGYITNWDAWKTTSAGVPGQGALTHLNIDYSKYTILNYSFFGVAKDGSLHSGDHRNKQIYAQGSVQEPNDIFFTDIYSSWDMHILFGEIDPIQHVNEDAKARAEAQGFQVELNANTWTHPTWGLSGPLPIPLHKEGGAPGLLELAHQKGVKVMASLGGWSMCKHFPEMAADPVKKARFLEDCKKLIAVGFDGIDLDWEYPGPYAGMNFTGSNADFANFATLVQDIRNAIGPDKLITSAMSADPRKLEGHDWSSLSQNMDYFNMMTYDYNGGWSNKASHNAPVYPYTDAEVSFFSWQSTLDKLVELNVPKSKICFGAPFYGRGVITDGTADLNVATVKRAENIQPDGPIQTAADYTNWKKEVYDGTPNHFFIKQQMSNGWTRKWDDEAKVPYLVKDNFFLSYDDEESIGIKAQFINDNQLGGTIIWTVFGDLEFSGTATSFGTKLKRWSNVKSPLINKMNEVFAEGGTGGNVAPVVSITSPANNSTFAQGDAITITANASDPDGSVTKVEFYDGSTKLGEDTTAPYEYVFQNAASGSHSLTAKATDNGGKSTTSVAVSITVEVDNNNVAPTVSITSPANNATFDEGASIVINANASDSDGTVAKVEFFNGTTKLGEDTTSPYSFTISSAAAGTYSLTATATDDKGANTVSTAVSVTVNGDTTGGECNGIAAWSASTTYFGGDNVQYSGVHYRAKWWTLNQTPNTHTGDGQPWEKIADCGGTGGGNTAPTVSITSPSNGTSVNEGTSIAIAASASDSDGTVTKVEFFNGSTKLGEDTTSPYNYTIANAAAGSYTLTAKATDDKNASTTSASVTVTVTGDTTGGGCDGIVQYVAGTSYSLNQEVQNAGGKYTCNIPGWCSSTAAWAYAPGTGAHWQTAWSKTGDCSAAKSSLADAVRVFPNPATSEINVSVNAANTNFRLQVYTISGAKVLDFKDSQLNGSFRKTFDISNLKSGLYMYTVSLGNENVQGKLVVNN